MTTASPGALATASPDSVSAPSPQHQGVRSRLIKGFGAQAFGQVVNLIIQVGSVPLFLHLWGKELYGEWLLLTAIPSYFALSDLGFASAAGTEMTILVARGDREGALRVFQSAWVLVSALSLALAAFAIAGAAFLPVGDWLGLHRIGAAEVRLLLPILILQVFFSMQRGLIGLGYRSDGNFAVGSMAGNLKRLFEFSALALALALGGGPVTVSVAYLGAEIVSNVAIALDVRRRSPWLEFGTRHADRGTIRSLTGPALSFMGFPLGHAMSLQGMVTVIGVTLGPEAVVLFSTMRTLTRSAAQVLGAITNTVWVELSTAFGAGDMPLARSLHRRACQASLWLALLLCALLLLVGRVVFERWTRGQVAFDVPLFLLLLAVTVCNSLWSASYVVPVAANRHQKVALTYVVATAASLLGAALLTRGLQVHGAALALLLIDIVMVAFVVPISLRMVGDETGGYARAVVTLPKDLPGRLLARRKQRA